MKNINKLFYVLLSILSTNISFAWSIKDSMIPTTNTIWVTWDGLSPLTQVMVYFKDFLFYILWTIAVWVFLYFWFKIITAKWNEEEFKKSLMWFLYAIVWLAIIPLAWGAVKIISTLKF